jgi:spoIIIJ-associated protein
MTKINNTVKKELEKILDLMVIKADIEIEQNETLIFKIIPNDIKDSSLLVGWHGQTLKALEHLLKVISSQKLKDKYEPFVIDVSGYRERRESYLKNIALKAADRVKSTGRSVVLDPMSPAERRIIHLVLSDFSDITTESIGEGEDRRTVIKKAE